MSDPVCTLEYLTQHFRVALLVRGRRRRLGARVARLLVQGSNEDETLDNIKEAIYGDLSVANTPLEGAEIREIEVAINPGVSHQDAVRALQKTGINIVRRASITYLPAATDRRLLRQRLIQHRVMPICCP